MTINGRIDNVENKLEKQIEEIDKKVQIVAKVVEEKTASIKKDLEWFKNQVMGAETYPEISNNLSMLPRSSIKISMFNEKSSWQVYKTQFAVVAEANGWDSQTKVCQLAASLRTDAADVLQTLSEKELLDFETLVSALEMLFGEKCMKEYSRLQLKTRRKKPTESLHKLTTDIEKLSNRVFPDCLIDIRETLALHHFIGRLRDPEIQNALRIADLKDLKGALIYALKFEAANKLRPEIGIL